MDPWRSLWLFPLFPAALLGCAAGEDRLQSFTVTLVGVSDCAQVEQAPVSCLDPAELSAVRQQVRWWVEMLDDDIFMLYDQSGRAVPGVRFANNGRVLTGACEGGGGDCLFARTTTTDSERVPGCEVTEQYVVDVTHVDDELQGELLELAYTEETCPTLYLAERRVRIEGLRDDEEIPARARYAP